MNTPDSTPSHQGATAAAPTAAAGTGATGTGATGTGAAVSTVNDTSPAASARDSVSPEAASEIERRLASAFLWKVVLVTLGLMVIALMLDVSVASAVQRGPTDDWLKAKAAGGGRWLAEILKLPGEFYVAGIAAVVVGLTHRHRWRAGLFIAAAALASSLNAVVKWIVGRKRPFRGPDQTILQPWELEPFRGGLLGVANQSNLSFPSGHAWTAFALAAALTLAFPRYRWWFLAGAAICAAERVLENAHWLSESVAAAPMGIALTLLIHTLLWPMIARPRAALPAKD